MATSSAVGEFGPSGKTKEMPPNTRPYGLKIERRSPGKLCPGSFLPAITIPPVAPGPSLHRCSVCDSARIKVERVARGIYMARAHYRNSGGSLER